MYLRKTLTRGLVFVALGLLWVLACIFVPTARAGSIFDDDYVPPTHTPPPSAKPPPEQNPTPTPAPQSSTRPTPVPAPQPSPATNATPAPVPAAGRALLSVPSAGDQAKSRKLFKEAFADDLKDASPAARKSLAVKLVGEADKVNDNPCDRFVLLVGACNAAVESSDLHLAMDAAKSISATYQVDAMRLVADILLRTPMRATSHAQAADAVDAGLEIDQALEQEDDYATASQVLAALQPLVSKSQSAELRARTQVRSREVAEGRAAYEQFEAAKQKLVASPADPEANLVAGKFLWLRSDDVTAALHYLAKGADADLKTLAAGDIAATPGTDDVARADAWWAYYPKAAGPMKIAAERRAQQFYQSGLASATGILKIKVEKRIAQVDTDVSAYSAAHTVHLRVDPSLIRAKRVEIEKASTRPMPESLKGDVRITGSSVPYSFEGTIKVTDPATITVGAGAEIRGGTIDLGRNGHIVAAGEKGRPVIFRHVTFAQDLSASLKADGAIFEDCEFKKSGGWFATYSSKWMFTSCVLKGCKFDGLTEVDYGFQIKECAFISMEFPEIKHPHKGEFNHATALHGEWNKIVNCTFVDCAVPPTVVWCAESSNYYECKFLPGEAFESGHPYNISAYVSRTVGPAPAVVWAANPPRNRP
jgi:hypothetical protein